MDVFYQKLREILESEDVRRDSDIGDFENWDSLGVLTILAMIDSVYKVPVSSEEFLKVRKVGDLEDLLRAKLGR
ncbi:MAG: acyl carrier protein [Holophaga sp.]|nr:acyl carrier protein [Holophaga sp.]